MMFTLASFWIFIILVANLRLLVVSSMWRASGQMLQIMTVLQLPPRLSLNMLVSFEER